MSRSNPTRPRRRLLSALASESVAEVAVWFLVLVLATWAAKLACLASVYRHRDGSVLEEMAIIGGAPLSRPALLALLLARDVVQSAAIAGCTCLVAALIPRARRWVFLRLTAVLLLLVIAVNHVSFMELGTFASLDVLMTAWRWVVIHPSALRAHLIPGAGALAATVLAAMVLPALFVRFGRRHRGGAAIRRWLALGALAGVVLASALSRLASARFGERAFAVRGYWESVAQAAWREEERSPLSASAPPAAVLLSEYQRLALSPSNTEPAKLLFPALEARIRPRHIVIVALETAPRAFYPLTTSPDLPTFRRMTERAIVSDRHYTTSSYTRIANFSILSGLYAPLSGLPVRFGPIATDGLATMLAARGYETTYVDSWVLDWLPGSGERDQAHMLGFEMITDSDARRDDGVYEVLVKGEQVAFDAAFARVAAAEDAGRKALVFVGTMLGHAPWPTSIENERLEGPARLHAIAQVFDRLLSRLLSRFSERGLAEDVLVLVVGDHGLRYEAEFASLGLSYSHSDYSFDVPFLLYAPGLVEETVHVPFATSHVDIAPTLMHLVGAPTEGLLHHGGYILDQRLAQRILYLPSSRLGPIDGLSWGGHHLTRHALSGETFIGLGSDPASMKALSGAAEARALPASLSDPAALLDAFEAHADRAAALILQRGASQRLQAARTTP